MRPTKSCILMRANAKKLFLARNTIDHLHGGVGCQEIAMTGPGPESGSISFLKECCFRVRV